MNKKFLILGAIGAATVLGAVGGTSLNALSANAQTTSTSSATPAPADQSGQPQHIGQFDPNKSGHTGQNGIKEELLTGETAEKVKAAALAAVPGGTIQRVETDAEGSPYEAHMTKSDGTQVTVKVDSSFTVISTEEGMR